MGAIATIRGQLQSRNRALSDLKSPTRAAMDGAMTLGGAFAAGAMDKYVGPAGVGGVRPSAAAGLLAAGAGIALGSPSAIKIATGLLAPSAYDAGGQAIDMVTA